MKKTKTLLDFYLPLTLILVFLVFPFLWTGLTSLKPLEEMFTETVHYWPQHPTLDNYGALLGKTVFAKNLFNSLVVASITAAISIVIAVMAGYAFSRFRFAGRNLLLGGILLLYLFPQVLFMVPLYMIFLSLGLIGSYWSLVIAYSTYTVPFAIWLMTGFVNEVPVELEEAGRIDGCELFAIFRYILLPLLRPAMVAAGSYIFITAWNEYLYAVLFTGEETKTVTVALADFVGQFNVRWDMLTAGGIIAAAPVLVIFLFIQKTLIKGMTAGSVKG